MAGGRPTKYTDDMCNLVPEMGTRGLGLAEIARELGVARDTVNDWRNNKPEFSAAIKEAQSNAEAWYFKTFKNMAMGDVDGAIDAVFNTFDAPKGQIGTDVVALVEELLAKGLLVVTPT